MNIQEIVKTAIEAAQKAEAKYITDFGGDLPGGCGFAWVEVEVSRTNSAESLALRASGFKRDYKPKTLSMWNPGGSMAQSMDIKYAGAEAFVEVLRAYGIKARAQSRED